MIGNGISIASTSNLRKESLRNMTAFRLYSCLTGPSPCPAGLFLKWYPCGLIHRLVVLLILVSGGCRQRIDKETPTSGQLVVYCDESISPPFEAARRAFESTYPKSKIQFIVSPAGNAVARLLNGQARFVITAGDLDSHERAFAVQHEIEVFSQKVALDGLAILVHRSNPLVELDMGRLSQVLSGRITEWKSVADSLPFPRGVDRIDLVCDGVQSSNRRFLESHVLEGFPMSANARLLSGDSTESVAVHIMEYVAAHPSSMGYVSTAWLGEQPEHVMRADRIKTLRLSGVDFQRTVDPIPGYIYRGDYPLRRMLYVINGTKTRGLGAGFTAFLTGNDGQRILLNSNLVPAINPVKLVHE